METLAKKRLFIGFPVPENISVHLKVLEPTVNGWGATLRWVPAQNFHVTLHFLGITDTSKIPELADACRALASRAAGFAYRTAGLGAFYSKNLPMNLWLRVADSEAAFQNIHTELRGPLRTLGFSTEKRPFTPHITIAKLKHPAGTHFEREAFYRWLEEQSLALFLRATELVLYESETLPEGSRYVRIHSFPLR